MLRDMIVCGINNCDIRQLLIDTGNSLTLETAITIATSFETVLIDDFQSVSIININFFT